MKLFSCDIQTSQSDSVKKSTKKLSLGLNPDLFSDNTYKPTIIIFHIYVTFTDFS